MAHSPEQDFVEPPLNSAREDFDFPQQLAVAQARNVHHVRGNQAAQQQQRIRRRHVNSRPVHDPSGTTSIGVSIDAAMHNEGTVFDDQLQPLLLADVAEIPAANNQARIPKRRSSPPPPPCDALAASIGENARQGRSVVVGCDMLDDDVHDHDRETSRFPLSSYQRQRQTQTLSSQSCQSFIPSSYPLPSTYQHNLPPPPPSSQQQQLPPCRYQLHADKCPAPSSSLSVAKPTSPKRPQPADPKSDEDMTTPPPVEDHPHDPARRISALIESKSSHSRSPSPSDLLQSFSSRMTKIEPVAAVAINKYRDLPASLPAYISTFAPGTVIEADTDMDSVVEGDGDDDDGEPAVGEVLRRLRAKQGSLAAHSLNRYNTAGAAPNASHLVKRPVRVRKKRKAQEGSKPTGVSKSTR